MNKKSISLFERIFRSHRRVLKNLSVKNNNHLVIGIAGVPGSGKTLLARSLSRRYHAVRVSNDEIRRIINKIRLERYRYRPTAGQQVLQDYLFYFLSAFTKKSPNKFFILDSGIERKYPRVISWCRKNKYRFFIVQIKLSRKQLLKNLGGRRKSTKRYLPYLPKWLSEYRDFANRKLANITFYNRGRHSDLRLFIKSLDSSKLINLT